MEGSPAARADAALLSALKDSGEQVAGLTTSVVGVSEVTGEACPAEQWAGARCARVSLRQGPTTWTGGDGAHEAPAPQAREVVLGVAVVAVLVAHRKESTPRGYRCQGECGDTPCGACDTHSPKWRDEASSTVGWGEDTGEEGI